MLNSKKSKQKAIIGLLSAAITMPMISFAANEEAPVISSQSHQKHQKMDRKVLKKMAKYLALNEEQIAQIKAIRQQAKIDGATLRTNIKPYFESIKPLMATPVFEEQTFNEIHAQYQDHFAQIALHKAKVKHAIYQVLTPEQQLQWDEFNMKNKNKRMGKI